MRTFVIVVQTYIVRCAFEGISKAYSACGRCIFGKAPSRFILSLLPSVPFLFSFIDYVARLVTFVSTIAYFADLYVVCRRKEDIRG